MFNMKINRVFFIFGFLFFSSVYSISAQNSGSLFSLSDVLSSLTSKKVTCGDFILEKTSSKIKRPLKASGKYIFCDTGVVWQTLKPFPSTMTVTKTSLIQVLSDGTKTVTDGNSNEVFKSIAQTLSTLFSGDKEALEKYFTIKSFNSSASEWKLVLLPKDKTISTALKKIELGGGFREKNASLDRIAISQSETDLTIYTLFNQSYFQELNNEQKSFFQ